MNNTNSQSGRRAADPTYIYIAGRGHSGSTLLTMLLARHPKVAAAGELANLSLQIARDEKARWVGRCSCGERPFDCAVWGKVLANVGAANGVDLTSEPFSWKISDVGLEEEHRSAAPLKVPFVWLRNRLWRMLRYAQYLLPAGLGSLLGFYRPQKHWGQNRSELARHFAAECGADAIIDASKDPLDMRDVYHHATVPVKIIFLTRDCRGNVWSMLKRLRPGQNREERVTTASQEWAKVNGRIWRLVKGVPDADWLHVRYEDMCREPNEVLAKVFEFAGLEPIDVIAATGNSEDDSDRGHTIGGNRIRFTSESLTIREDKAWQSKLTEEEIGVIATVAGPLARELGYEI